MPDDECKMMASAGFVLYCQAVRELRDGSSSFPIDVLIREKFALLEKSTTELQLNARQADNRSACRLASCPVTEWLELGPDK